jgi:hypothetical protein
MTPKKNTVSAPKPSSSKKAPKNRVGGQAKGKIWVAPDCWTDDFEN